jgi:hypothetical protein
MKKKQDSPDAVDPRIESEDTIHWDQDITYGGFLSLVQLLECQKLRTGAHD